MLKSYNDYRQVKLRYDDYFLPTVLKIIKFTEKNLLSLDVEMTMTRRQFYALFLMCMLGKNENFQGKQIGKRVVITLTSSAIVF